jgi:hypothetical protein
MRTDNVPWFMISDARAATLMLTYVTTRKVGEGRLSDRVYVEAEFVKLPVIQFGNPHSLVIMKRGLISKLLY